MKERMRERYRKGSRGDETTKEGVGVEENRRKEKEKVKKERKKYKTRKKER